MELSTQHSVLSTQHLFFSPHFDDAPLSCGGLVAQLTQRRESVLVVTVCSQTPPADLPRSSFAADMQQQWRESSGESVADTYIVRRAEEVRALAMLGAEHRWLDYLDAIYRRPYYDSDATLFGPPVDDDLRETLPALQADIADIIAEHPGARLYFPLAVGNHVDHQLLHLVGRKLAAADEHEVEFYEDFPYVEVEGALERRLAQIPLNLAPLLTDIGDTLPDKIAAIAAYTSQMSILFGGDVAMRERVLRYAAAAAQADGEEMAERYWKISFELGVLSFDLALYL